MPALISAFGSGVVAGYAVAVPIGPVATYLISLSARTALRVGMAAGMGAATVDGSYALLALAGGGAVVGLIEPAVPILHWVAVGVLAFLGLKTLSDTLRHFHDPARAAAILDPTSPRSAYLRFVAITMLNPSTLVYFSALAIGLQRHSGSGADTVVAFTIGAFAASTSWGLTLAGGGAALGRWLTSARGRLGLGVVSGVLITALALRLALT